MRQIRYTHVAAILLLIAAYVGLRLWRLTETCLWFDEIFSVHAAEHSWNSILNFVALDLIHPPLFYVLLKFWISVGGESLLWLRMLPVVFSIFAIFPFIALCRELKLNFWTQALALFLLAVNGSLIKYAQEVRMYSLLMCLSLFSMWLFVRYFYRGKNFTALVVVNILLVYTHYFGWLVIVSEIVAVLLLNRARLRQVLSMSAIACVAFLPWLFAVISAAQSGPRLAQNIGWMERPGLREITVFVFDLTELFYHQSSSGDPESLYPYSVLILLIMVAAAMFFFWRFRNQPEEVRSAAVPLLIFGVVPILVAFAASWLFPYSVWGIRHLIIMIAPVMILISMSLARLKPIIFVVAMVFIILIAFVPSVFLYLRVQSNVWCGWDRQTAKLEQTTDIYAAEELIAYHIWFARRGTGQKVFMVHGLDGVREDPAYFLPRGFDEVKTVDVAEIDAERIAVAFRGGNADEGQPPLRAFSEKGYQAVSISQGVAGPETTNVVVLERR